jgi:uncharacterized paraquat-inducible protein A
MPWCDDCSAYWRAPELGEGGVCPTCGRTLDTTPAKSPWHFKLLMVSLVIYLSYRLVQGVAWLAHKM